MLPRTPSQTVGPYYSIGLERRAQNELVPPTDPAAIQLRGRLLDGADEPIDGMIEVWNEVSGTWGRSGTDADGWFDFTVAKPQGRNGEAPRLDVYVFARGLLEHQLTRIYFPDEREVNDVDPVLSGLGDDERARLVAREDGGDLRFDIRMQGEDAAVFFAV
jgi:protocatechuate 3,4-dioxygenase alpha subunit